MDVERAWHFLHKTVRNIVPARRLQQACIAGMRRALFPQTLSDIRIDMAEALRSGTAEKRFLRPAASSPSAALVSLTGDIPEALALPEMPVPELNDYILSEGYCFRCFVLDKKKRFITDATPSDIFRKALYRNNQDIRTKAPVRIDGDAIALCCSYMDNYYHWFVDLVGRMLLLPDWHSMRIITDTSHAWQTETLRLLGVPADRVAPMTDHALFHVERLHVISAPWAVSLDSYMAVQALSGRLTPDSNRHKRPKRLFISRNTNTVASRRGIINEQELLPVLEEYGFQKVYFPNLPLAEQMRSMAAAEYVILPHGAGAANLLFCGPHVRFLEIFSPWLLAPNSVYITKTLGLTHHILIGTSGPDERAHAPFRVDPQALRSALELLLKR